VMLDGRTVVVAGVGPGLGRAIVETSARQGANVVAAARTAERLADIVRGLPDPARALAVSADISDLASCRHLAELAVDRFGGIDGVVNNAVWLPASAPMPDTMEADWSRAFDVNVTGPWRVVMASLDALAASGRGAVVNVGSQAAKRSSPGLGIYAASKSALTTITDSMATELGTRGVRVNEVIPGSILGPALAAYLEGEAERSGIPVEQALEQRSSHAALRRLVSPQEIANVVVFLLSDLASGVTGAHVDVDCGVRLGR